MSVKPRLVAKQSAASPATDDREPAAKAGGSEREKGLARLVVDPHGNFKKAGVSDYVALSRGLVHQAMQTGWYGNASTEEAEGKIRDAAITGMLDIAPKDGTEGMVAAQMVATHNAAMECFRRAMIAEQPLQARDLNLSQANKLTRSFATLVQALDKHRGKGQQTVRVEHVHVHSGGQAIVGNVGPGTPPSLPPAPAVAQIGKADEEGMAVVAEGVPLDALSLVGGGSELGT